MAGIAQVSVLTFCFSGGLGWGFFEVFETLGFYCLPGTI